VVSFAPQGFVHTSSAPPFLPFHTAFCALLLHILCCFEFVSSFLSSLLSFHSRTSHLLFAHLGVVLDLEFSFHFADRIISPSLFFGMLEIGLYGLFRKWGCMHNEEMQQGGQREWQKEQEDTGRSPRRLAALQRHRSVGGDRRKGKGQEKWRKRRERSGTMGKARTRHGVVAFTP
jgi:hypothetical protein